MPMPLRSEKVTVCAWALTARLRVKATHANITASVGEVLERFIEISSLKKCLCESARKTSKTRARKPRGLCQGPVRDDYWVTTNCGLLLRVPDGVTTETFPVVAPAGTVALMYVSDTTVKLACTPLNRTPVVPVRFFPRMRTRFPTFAPVGTVSAIGLRPVESLKTVP